MAEFQYPIVFRVEDCAARLLGIDGVDIVSYKIPELTRLHSVFRDMQGAQFVVQYEALTAYILRLHQKIAQRSPEICYDSDSEQILYGGRTRWNFQQCLTVVLAVEHSIKADIPHVIDRILGYMEIDLNEGTDSSDTE